MRRKVGRLVLLCMIIGCMAGCDVVRPPKYEEKAVSVFPLKSDEEVVLLGWNGVGVLNTRTFQIVRKIEIEERSMFYHGAMTKEGKIYLPLDLRGGPNPFLTGEDALSRIAVLDPKSKGIKYVKTLVGGFGEVRAIGDAVYIDLGITPNNRDFWMHVLNTQYDLAFGNLLFPYTATGFDAYKDNQIIAPFREKGSHSQLYVGGSIMLPPEPVLKEPIPIDSLAQVRYDPKKDYTYLLFVQMEGDWRKQFLAKLQDPKMVDVHIAVVDMAKKEVIRRIYVNQAEMEGIRFVIDADGNAYIPSSSGVEKGKDTLIAIVNTTTGEVRSLTTGHTEPLPYVADGKLYVCGRDAVLEVYDVRDLKRIARVQLEAPCQFLEKGR